MFTDTYSNIVATEDDILHLLLTNPQKPINRALVEFDVNIPEELELDKFPILTTYIPPTGSVEEYDAKCQENWHMPVEYKTLDIVDYVVTKCKSDVELQRVATELEMFEERGMMMLLRYLVYLVDTMKKNNVVWGVGRGSSVASYVLYLIGMHRINSILYELDISEFLK